MSPKSPHVLLLGGHGKTSLLMTPLMVSRGWNLTSVIRNADQKNTILEAGGKGPGKVDVLVESLDDVAAKGEEGGEKAAKEVLERVKPDWVVWAAGAGGKGGASRTYAIDRDACISFIRASLATPSISKFLLVSALSSRHHRASWWTDEDWATVQKMNTQFIPDYFKAKLAADDVLADLGNERVEKGDGFEWISLRPGGLGEEPATNKIKLGQTKAKGMVQRADVADVAVRLLEKGGVSGWVDMLGGESSVESEVDRIIKEGVDDIIAGEYAGKIPEEATTAVATATTEDGKSPLDVEAIGVVPAS